MAMIKISTIVHHFIPVDFNANGEHGRVGAKVDAEKARMVRNEDENMDPINRPMLHAVNIMFDSDSSEEAHHIAQMYRGNGKKNK